MIITRTAIDGVFLLELERREDERGFFARAFCHTEFEAAGLEPTVRQGNLSFNHHAGTLRGLHYQVSPHEETKLVRCTRGAIHDVVVDLRKGSPTYLKHVAARLDADNRRAIYVPRYCAHGFLTLEPNSEANYLVSSDYVPASGAGLRYDDPALAIDWPHPVNVISDQDLSWALLPDPTPPGSR